MEQQKGYITRTIDFLRSWYRKDSTPETSLESAVKKAEAASLPLGPYRKAAEVPTESAGDYGGVSVIQPGIFKYLRKPESERRAGNCSVYYSGGYKISW